MSYQIKMSFEHEGDPIFELRSNYMNIASDCIISGIHSLISLLEFSSIKIEDDELNDLKYRFEIFRSS